LGNILFTLRKKQENVQQGGYSASSPVRRKSRTTALQLAQISSKDEKDHVDLSKQRDHDRFGEVWNEDKFGESVNSTTGKKDKNDPYQFGDLTKWVDRQARTRVLGGLSLLSSKNNNETASQMEREVNNRKEQPHNNKPLIDHPPFQKFYAEFGKKVNSITGKKDPYEFGDLTKWLDTEARSGVKDVTKVAKKVRWDKKRHNIDEEDGEDDQAVSQFISVVVGSFTFFRSVLLVQIIRLVVKLGVERPVLTRLPSSILMELVHLILDGNYRPLVLRVVATELDKRFKVAICGDEDYQFGDLSKKALAKFTGKDQYKFGDITKGILERAQASEKATDRDKDQIQKELQVVDENIRSLSAGSKSSYPRRRGIRIPTLRWLQK
jgi:hypothetical protein